MKKLLTAIFPLVLCTVPAYAAKWSCPSCTESELKTLFDKHAPADKIDAGLQTFESMLDKNTNTLNSGLGIVKICWSMWGKGGKGSEAYTKCNAFATDMIVLAKSKQKKSNTPRVASPANLGGAVVCKTKTTFSDDVDFNTCQSVVGEDRVAEYRNTAGYKVFDISAEYDAATGSWKAPEATVEQEIASNVAIAVNAQGKVVSAVQAGQELNLTDRTVSEQLDKVTSSFKKLGLVLVGGAVLFVKSLADVAKAWFELNVVLTAKAINALNEKRIEIGNKLSELKDDALLTAKSAYKGVKAFISDTGQKIIAYKDAAGRKIEEIYDTGGQMIAKVVDGVVEIVNTVSAAAVELWGNIKAMAGKLSDGAKRVVGIGAQAIVFGVSTAAGTVLLIYDETGRLVKAGISGMTDAAIAYKNKFEDGWSLLQQDAADELAKVEAKVKQIVQEKIEAEKRMYEAVVDATVKAAFVAVGTGVLAAEAAAEAGKKVGNFVLETTTVAGKKIVMVYDVAGNWVEGKIDGAVATAQKFKGELVGYYNAGKEAVERGVENLKAKGIAAVNKGVQLAGDAKDAVVAGFKKVTSAVKAVADFQAHVVKVTVLTAVGTIVLAYDEMGRLKDAVVEATTDAARNYVQNFSDGLTFIKQDLSDVAEQAKAKALEFERAAQDKARYVKAKMMGAGRYAWNVATSTAHDIAVTFDDLGNAIEVKIDGIAKSIDNFGDSLVAYRDLAMAKGREVAIETYAKLRGVGNWAATTWSNYVKVAGQTGSETVECVFNKTGDLISISIGTVQYMARQIGTGPVVEPMKEIGRDLWNRFGKALVATGQTLETVGNNMQSSDVRYANN